MTQDIKKNLEIEILKLNPVMFKNHPITFILCCLLSVVGIGIPVLLIWYLSTRNKQLTITSRRTILKTGILSKNTNEVRHKDIRNINVKQSLSGRIFGVGTIEISSAGQSGIEIAVSGIENPEEVKYRVNEYRDD